MSLGVIIKATEGMVLAAESRVTLGAQLNTVAGTQQITVNFDNANKLLSFSPPFDRFGVVTYGLGTLGLRTAQSLIPEFETSMQGVDANISVLEFSQWLSSFFHQQWQILMPQGFAIQPGQGMIFNVAGFDDNEPYGTLYQFEVPNRLQPVEQNAKIGEQYQFGIAGGGQHEIMSRLIMGYDPNLFNILVQRGIITQQQVAQIIPMLEPIKLQTPVQFMPLQDCVNLAVLLIKTTIEAQSLAIGLRGCGGAIDVAIITKNNPLKFIQKKAIVVN
jgi:hypothetical protein